MAASQVVLYFDSEQDALHFTLAASSVISAQGNTDAAAKVAEEICKVSRIATEGPLRTPDCQQSVA